MKTIFKRYWRTAILTLLVCSLGLGWSNPALALGKPQRESRLPVGNAITDGKALLRYSLPIDNQPIREVQASLEDISNQLRGKRWRPIQSDASKADSILSQKQEEILEAVPAASRGEAEGILAQLRTAIATLQTATEAKDREQIWLARGQALDLVGVLEESMVAGFPYEVPEDYSHLPQLKGRATVEFETSKGVLTAVVDGYSAPVTAGNLVDLVQRGFYDGLEFTRAEESYVLQIGDPPGKEVGFIDPNTNQYRAIPLEILVEGDQVPTYGFTLEELGRYREQPVLPFSAFGALGMARPEAEPNGGSSQFFFFLFEPELTPAGLNLLDGRYAVFGYLTEGKEVLDQLKAGDRVISAKVVKGAENLVQPQAA